jgi:hypothetical protein
MRCTGNVMVKVRGCSGSGRGGVPVASVVVEETESLQPHEDTKSKEVERDHKESQSIPPPRLQ